MTTTNRGGQEWLSTPIIADHLLDLQEGTTRKTTATQQCDSLKAPKCSPESFWLIQLEDEFASMEKEAQRQIALLRAIRQVATINGNTLRQQVAVWRPFR